MAHCLNCKQESILISTNLKLCARCIKEHFDKVLPRIKKIHVLSRERFNLPGEAPNSPSGIRCDYCANECRMGDGEKGYCGLRINEKGRLSTSSSHKGYLSWYYDPLPTNCVGDWVCPGGAGVGYPEFSNSRGPEYGYKNLAVFYHGCNFNCLFCQNWHFREEVADTHRVSHPALELAGSVDLQTSCICYFGGDPTPQLSHALKASKLALDQNKDRILRICWETNGAMHPRLLKKMLEFSLKSGGCIKFDLKSWNEKLHIALCGVSNRRTIENFTAAAQWIKLRSVPPLIIPVLSWSPGI